jgi:uncharacterized membrane protein (Fun14 family)
MLAAQFGRHGRGLAMFGWKPRTLELDLRNQYSRRMPNVRGLSNVPDTEARTATSDANTQRAIDEDIPVVVRAVGYGGLIPFAAGAAAAASTGMDQYLALHVSQVYGASILSFLGAVHWGVALSETATLGRLSPIKATNNQRSKTGTQDFIYGVIPSLIGCGAAILDPRQGLAMLAPAYIAAFIYDSYRFSAPRAISVPSWYLRLRKRLTFGALLCLGFSFGVADPRLFAGGDARSYPEGNSVENLVVNVCHNEKSTIVFRR